MSLPPVLVRRPLCKTIQQAAVLQRLVYCGKCGRKMFATYRDSGSAQPICPQARALRVIPQRSLAAGTDIPKTPSDRNEVGPCHAATESFDSLSCL